MIVEIYAMKDTVVGAYKMPFYQQNRAVAQRTAKWIAREGKPEDIEDKELYFIGRFDDETGLIAGAQNGPEYILNMESLKENSDVQKTV